MPGLTITVKAGRLELDKRQVRKVIAAAGREIATVARGLARKSAGGGRTYWLPGSSGGHDAGMGAVTGAITAAVMG